MTSAFPFTILAQHAEDVAQTAREFSQSTGQHHEMASIHGPLDVFLVAFGIVVLVVTTTYTLLYFIRPRETGEDHIKRRILRDEG